ncbi:MAG TPA: amidohydrolase family protein [Flavisolibacter sp.]
MRLFTLSIFMVLFFSSGAQQLLIRNTNVVDVEGRKVLAGQSVLVENGRISEIGRNLTAPQGARVIDGNGKWLIPGLVDAHVHFSQSGGIYTRPDALDLRKYKPFSEEIAWTHNNMESFLRRYILAGITTVVDVGSTVNFLKQRDSFSSKNWAPAVYMTGPLLTTWAPQAFKGLKDDDLFYEMKTVEDARSYVQKQLPYKPDFIKIWYIVQGRNTDSAARKHLPLVQAVIEEAHAKGLRVAVHATERITAQLAVEAGADLLVHGIEDEPVDAAFVRLLKSKKTVLSPTLVVAGNYHKVFGQEYIPTKHDHHYAHPTPLRSILDLKGIPDTNLTNRYRRYVQSSRKETARTDSLLRANTKKLLDGGVIIATGTDAGNIGTQHASSYFDELEAMRQSGFDLWQLLQASTINGAKAIGKEAEFGSIKKGKVADMVLLTKNPLDSLSNWNSIEWVIRKGDALLNHHDVKPSPEQLADQQLAAYNAHDLEAVLAPYADNVEIFDFGGKMMMSGKESMRKAYQFLNHTPKLYCRLINRIVQGNKVVDHEEVWGFGPKPVYAVAIYEIEGGKIRKVHFFE